MADEAKDDATPQESPSPEEPQDEPEKQAMPQASFSQFIQGLHLQVVMALGQMSNPVTNETSKNLGHARYLIDMLDILEDKTKGNLDEDEARLLGNILYDVRMRFVNENKPQTQGQGEPQ